MKDQEIENRPFHWAWLLDNLTCLEIYKCYEIIVGEIYSDIMLKNKFDDSDLYLITRTSARCYRLMRFNHKRILYKSFKDAVSVSDYIYSNMLLFKYGECKWLC